MLLYYPLRISKIRIIFRLSLIDKSDDQKLDNSGDEILEHFWI